VSQPAHRLIGCGKRRNFTPQRFFHTSVESERANHGNGPTEVDMIMLAVSP
jgi:hypothetical protein